MEGSINMDLQGIGWWKAASGLMDQDRDRLWVLAFVVMNLQVPRNAENFLIICGIVTFSTNLILTLLHSGINAKIFICYTSSCR
jgi:hypothetical protein